MTLGKVFFQIIQIIADIIIASFMKRGPIMQPLSGSGFLFLVLFEEKPDSIKLRVIILF